MRTTLNASRPPPNSGISLVGIKKLSTGFDPETFLATAGVGKTVVNLKKKDAAFSQGDASDAVFFIKKGKLQLTVVSKAGKEATLGILSAGEFFGEGGLAGQHLRMGSATAMTDCELLRIDKKEMMLALHRESTFSDLFVAYLLARNIRYEEDLVDQLFNSSEKRLARLWFSSKSQMTTSSSSMSVPDDLKLVPALRPYFDQITGVVGTASWRRDVRNGIFHDSLSPI